MSTNCPITIVQLAASPFFGGPERQMLGLARHLPREYRTIFIAFADHGSSKNLLAETERHGFDGFLLENDTPHYSAAVRELVRHLRRLRADILCCNGYKPDILGWRAARMAGIPAVSISHGWTAATFKVRLNETVDRLVLRWMDRVVCVSQGQAVKVRKAGVPAHKIVVIRNAIDPAPFTLPDPAYRQTLDKLFPTPKRILIGGAGRLSPEKGFGQFVEAAAKVLSAIGYRPSAIGCRPSAIGCQPSADGHPPEAEGRTLTTESRKPEAESRKPEAGSRLPIADRRPPSLGFVLFGDGPLRADLQQRIKELGLEEDFVLAGFRPDLEKFLPHLDVAVLPSFTEGLPVVALEALAAGVPVVATAVGGTPEVVRDGYNGYLVPPGQPDLLAQRILDLLADETERTTMGQRGRNLVAADFTFASQSQKYQTLFGELLGRPRLGEPQFFEPQGAVGTR